MHYILVQWRAAYCWHLVRTDISEYSRRGCCVRCLDGLNDTWYRISDTHIYTNITFLAMYSDRIFEVFWVFSGMTSSSAVLYYTDTTIKLDIPFRTHGTAWVVCLIRFSRNYMIHYKSKSELDIPSHPTYMMQSTTLVTSSIKPSLRGK